MGKKKRAMRHLKKFGRKFISKFGVTLEEPKIEEPEIIEEVPAAVINVAPPPTLKKPEPKKVVEIKKPAPKKPATRKPRKATIRKPKKPTTRKTTKSKTI